MVPGTIVYLDAQGDGSLAVHFIVVGATIGRPLVTVKAGDQWSPLQTEILDIFPCKRWCQAPSFTPDSPPK